MRVRKGRNTGHRPTAMVKLISRCLFAVSDISTLLRVGDSSVSEPVSRCTDNLRMDGKRRPLGLHDLHGRVNEKQRMYQNLA